MAEQKRVEVGFSGGQAIALRLSDDSYERLRRSLSASLAGKMFARYPEARAVVVRLETFTPVAMEAWRRGERPQWSPLYTAKFVNQPQPKAELDHESDGG